MRADDSEPQSGTAEDWAQLDALLAEALELDGDARSAWLNALAVDRPGIAKRLRTLLGYLEHDTLLPDENPQRLRDQAALSLLEARPGTRFGAWTVIRPIGMGGMSEVYLARRELEQGVQLAALKLISASLAHTDAHARLARETAVLSQLSDPRIARLIDSGRTELGRPWFAMEFVHGKELDQGCDALELGIRDRVRVLLEVARAVEHAHRQLVVHRDIKPANVLIDIETRAVKLLDFGIARILAPTDEPHTATRAFTPAHASPEQLAGRHASTASDIFQLGALLYQLITGTRPFGEGDADLGLQLAQMEHGVEKPSQRVRHLQDTPPPRCAADAARLPSILRGDLDTIALKALEFDPQRRYLSARELADDLQRWLDGDPISARPDFTYRLGRRLRKHWIAVVASGVSVVLLIAYLVNLGIQRDALQAERNRTQKVLDALTGMFSAADPYAEGFDTVTVAEVVRTTSERMLATRDPDPEFQVLMLERLAALSNSARTHALQASLLREAVSIGNQARLDRSLRARVQLALAEALFGAGDLRAARAALDASVSDLSNAQRPAARLLAGKLHIEFGEHALARDLFTRLIRELPDGAEHAVLRAQAHNSYGILLRQTGDADGAIEQYRITLAEMPTEQPAHYDQILTTRSNLAIALGVQRRYPESEREFRDLLDWSIRKLGAGHPAVPTIARNYSTLLVRTLRFRSAWDLLRQHAQASLASGERIQHASYLEGLSTAGLYTEHLPDALEGALDSVQLRVEALGPSAPALRGSLNHLAWTLFEIGALDAAVQVARRVAPGPEDGLLNTRMVLVLSGILGLHDIDTSAHRHVIEADSCFSVQLKAMEAILAHGADTAVPALPGNCDGAVAARMRQLGASWHPDWEIEIRSEPWSSPLIERLRQGIAGQAQPLDPAVAQRLAELLAQLELDAGPAAILD